MLIVLMVDSDSSMLDWSENRWYLVFDNIAMDNPHIRDIVVDNPLDGTC